MQVCHVITSVPSCPNLKATGFVSDTSVPKSSCPFVINLTSFGSNNMSFIFTKLNPLINPGPKTFFNTRLAPLSIFFNEPF